MAKEMTWTEEFLVYYKFQCQQQLKVSLFKEEDSGKVLVGNANTDVSKNLAPANPHKLYNLDNENVGTLILKCDESVATKQKIIFELACAGLDDLDTLSKSDPFLRIYREAPGAGWNLIYETKVVMDNLNPTWDPIVMDYSHFCHCNPDLLIKVECWDYDSPTSKELIGETVFTALSLVKGKTMSLINPSKMANTKYKNSGQLIVKDCQFIMENSFIDYLRGGMNINLCIAIDYTASNGIYSNTNSLHNITEGQQNEYESAMRLIGSILSSYDSDENFAVFGFGGKPN